MLIQRKLLGETAIDFRSSFDVQCMQDAMYGTAQEITQPAGQNCSQREQQKQCVDTGAEREDIPEFSDLL